MSELDCDAILGNWVNWIPKDGTNSSCASGISVEDTGDNPQTVFAFFRAAGLDDMHAAAVYGNLYQESGLDPTIMQKGGSSNKPADADPGGWGLAQWTPGSKVTGIAQTYNITDPIYKLVPQLNLILAEMKGTSPAGVNDTFVGLQKQTTLEDAVNYFMNEFEAAGVSGPRVLYAQQALDKFAGGSFNLDNSTAGCASAALSPDCQAAAGSAKIICAAKAYDKTSYVWGGGHGGAAAWHSSCPTVDSDCGLDCSGLVNIAVYDAFGVDLRENTGGERDDNKNWSDVSFDQIQPGDLLQPGRYGGDHVEIIDHVAGDKIFTFGAHTSHTAQPDQVGPSGYTKSSGDLYLHFTGTGA